MQTSNDLIGPFAEALAFMAVAAQLQPSQPATPAEEPKRTRPASMPELALIGRAASALRTKILVMIAPAGPDVGTVAAALAAADVVVTRAELQGQTVEESLQGFVRLVRAGLRR